MFTPQQLEQVTFHTSVFGGYDMDSVDEFLVALIEDYNTLYKDNATLKSKMRILVEKLEEIGVRSTGPEKAVPKRACVRSSRLATTWSGRRKPSA